MKWIFWLINFVENGNDCNHMLAINNEKGDRRNKKNYEIDYRWLQVKLLWIPVIGPKIRKELNKIGWNAYFPPAVNWKSIYVTRSEISYRTATVTCIRQAVIMQSSILEKRKNVWLHDPWTPAWQDRANH